MKKETIVCIVLCALLLGCSKKVRIGNDYLIVRPETLPDGHPGTELYYLPTSGPKKLIWGNYFSVGSGNGSYRDGILVFAGPDNDEPGDGVGATFLQLYAVRGEGPVILLTQRVAQEPVFRWTKDGHAGVEIDRLETTTNGIRVTFTHLGSHTDTNSTVKEISWDEIKAMVEEGKTATNRKTKYWGSYVVLPVAKSGDRRDAADAASETNSDLPIERPSARHR